MPTNTRSRSQHRSAAKKDETMEEEQQPTVFALKATGSKALGTKEFEEPATQNHETLEQSTPIQQEKQELKRPEAIRVSSNKKVREKMRLLKLAEEQAANHQIQTEKVSELGSKEDREDGSSMVAAAHGSPGEVHKSGDGDRFVTLPEAMTTAPEMTSEQPKGVGHENEGSVLNSPIGMQPDSVIPTPVQQTETSGKEKGDLQTQGSDKGESTLSQKDVNNANVEPGKSKSPWLDAVKNNRKVEFMGRLRENLEGVTDVGVTLTAKDITKEEDMEARCLIGLFNGGFPGRDMVQRMVDRWPKRCKFHFHLSGWIVFQFDNEQDCLFVLNSAHFTAGNKNMIVKQMPRSFDFSKEEYLYVPVWIQLPNLPLNCWNDEALSKICTFIGKPLHIDKVTKDMDTVSFARCMVEIDLRDKHPTVMELNIEGKKVEQRILYEESPSYCNKCKKVGHQEEVCFATSIPGETPYIPRARMEAQNQGIVNRGRSKKRINTRTDSRGISKAPRSRGASKARGQNWKPRVPSSNKLDTRLTKGQLEQAKFDRAMEMLDEQDKEMEVDTAGRDVVDDSSKEIVPVSNSFEAIKWADQVEQEEAEQINGNSDKGIDKAIPSVEETKADSSKLNGHKGTKDAKMDSASSSTKQIHKNLSNKMNIPTSKAGTTKGETPPLGRSK